MDVQTIDPQQMEEAVAQVAQIIEDAKKRVIVAGNAMAMIGITLSNDLNERLGVLLSAD